MRLIDADALKERYENHRKLYCKNRIEFKLLSEKDKARVDELDNCIADILNAPTIEPERKKGKWILVEESIKIAAYKCSECGRSVWTDRGYDVMKDYPYCHCGAEMRGEQE